MQRFQTVDDSIDDLKQAFRAFVSLYFIDWQTET